MDDGRVRLGAGVTYTRVIDELGALLPGLAMASRTVGSPQIRNRGTVGGNLGAASPPATRHPPLLAARRRRRAGQHGGHAQPSRSTSSTPGSKRNAPAPTS